MHVLQVHLWSHPALMTLPQPPSIPATATRDRDETDREQVADGVLRPCHEITLS